ncbi:hypothetical protein D039_0762A, partial [Vibrio parahaemolyticus EKP-028]
MIRAAIKCQPLAEQFAGR